MIIRKILVFLSGSFQGVVGARVRAAALAAAAAAAHTAHFCPVGTLGIRVLAVHRLLNQLPVLTGLAGLGALQQHRAWIIAAVLQAVTGQILTVFTLIATRAESV